MLGNILIFLIAVGIVLAYVAVIHRWLSKPSSSEPEADSAPGGRKTQGH
jgi:hypothetical protein